MTLASEAGGLGPIPNGGTAGTRFYAPSPYMHVSALGERSGGAEDDRRAADNERENRRTCLASTAESAASS